MKYLFFSLIACILLGASVCCAPTQPPNSPERQEKEFVESLQDKTVALIKKDDDGIYPFCSGVWVAKDLILTALHCLKGENLIIQYKSLKDKDSDPRYAAAFKFDGLNDLLLLKALPETIPNHPIAKIATKDWTGEKAHIVGHPNGLWWTYFQGTISSRKKIFDKEHNGYQKLLQISAPVWKGNSGGGAFDSNGDLLGISSWIMLDVPSVSFFVHRESILDFLNSSNY